MTGRPAARLWRRGYTRQDRLAEVGGPGELRPVPGGQVDVPDLADPGEFPDGRVSLFQPLPEHLGGELAGDDGDGYVVAPIVGAPQPVGRDVFRWGDGAGPERLPQV